MDDTGARAQLLDCFDQIRIASTLTRSWTHSDIGCECCNFSSVLVVSVIRGSSLRDICTDANRNHDLEGYNPVGVSTDSRVSL